MINAETLLFCLNSSTFNAEVTCDRHLPLIAFNGYFPTSDDLTALCTFDCLQSLQALSTAQQESCAADVVRISGENYPVTATTDALMWTYNFTCRRDASSGAFCAPSFDQWVNGNATDKSCTDCVLGTYQIELQSPLGWDESLASRFASLTSSCQATNYPVTSPTPNYITTVTTASTTSSAAAAKSCASTYTVQSADDCHSISTSQQVSTAALIYLNNLEADCTNFPTEAGTKLCMPHTCEIYTIQQNDTCWSITDGFTTPETGQAFTISQLISWNIDISPGCDNLNLGLLAGHQICVSFPGDVSAPTATAPASTATLAPVPTNVVEGTNTQCGRYYEVRGGDTCAIVTNNQGLSLVDFYFLNPEVNSTCGNLLLGYSYCVQAVGDINSHPGYGGKLSNPCVGGKTTAAASCYATTYSTADAWIFPPVNTTVPTSTGNGSTTSQSYSSTSVSAYSTSVVVNPTPLPYQSDMVAGCGRFYFVRSKSAPNTSLAGTPSADFDILPAIKRMTLVSTLLSAGICLSKTSSTRGTRMCTPTAPACESPFQIAYNRPVVAYVHLADLSLVPTKRTRSLGVCWSQHRQLFYCHLNQQ